MKKTLSILLTICMLMMTSLVSMPAMASETKPSAARIETQMSGCAYTLVASDATFGCNNAADLLTFIRSGKDMSDYKEAFVNDVKANLTANSGKLATQSSEWVFDGVNWIENITTVESPATYGAVALCLDAFGLDPEDFEGYDILDAFANVPVAGNADNPYLYRITLEAASYFGLDDSFQTAVCDELINNYYTVGSGMDYYGFNCDNTAMFIVAIGPYADQYETELADALALLETYKTDGGYFSNSMYGTDANADSTGLVLAAYSVMEDLEASEAVYNELCGFEVDEGEFGYTDNTTYNAYATKDALIGLEYFYASLPLCYDGHTFIDDEPYCEVCGEENPDFDWDEYYGSLEEEEPDYEDDPEEETDDGNLDIGAFDDEYVSTTSKDLISPAPSIDVDAENDTDTAVKSPATGSSSAIVAASLALLASSAAVIIASKKKED